MLDITSEETNRGSYLSCHTSSTKRQKTKNRRTDTEQTNSQNLFSADPKMELGDGGLIWRIAFRGRYFRAQGIMNKYAKKHKKDWSRE